MPQRIASMCTADHEAVNGTELCVHCAFSPSRRRRFLAAGSTLRSISFDFRVGRSTACDVVADVCAALWDILKPLYLVSPQTADEWIKARNWFNSLCFRVHTFF